MKINWRIVIIVLVAFFIGVTVLGSFEHNLQLQAYKRLEDPTWHWFWSTQITWMPHHQWWGLMGVVLGFFYLAFPNFVMSIKSRLK